jgi:hypothetical protein
MIFPAAKFIFVRQLLVFSVAVQLALALLGTAADVSEDSSLQGDLIEPIGKTPVNTAPAPTNTIQSGDFVGFDQLAGFSVKLNNELIFNTNQSAWADAQISAMIPERIRAASGKLVNVDGFMIPLEYNGKKVSKFILAMNQNTCCFGGNPQIHEFIIVYVNGPGVPNEMDIPLRVRGVLHVGVQRSHGKLTGVYQLDATSVKESPAG